RHPPRAGPGTAAGMASPRPRIPSGPDPAVPGRPPGLRIERIEPTEGWRSMANAEQEPVVHILWMNGGLGCDGDSVALTAATQPSIEEIVLGALPGLPKVAVHWP